jgi:hypothetical protein
MAERILPPIDDVLLEFREHLRECGLLEPDNADNVRVWMKGATPKATEKPDDGQLDGSAARAAHFSDRLSDLLGLPIDMLSTAGEANHLYQSTLRGQDIPRHQSAAVLEVGETRTLVSFGRGGRPESASSTFSDASSFGNAESCLELGWGRLLLDNLPDPEEVRLARLDLLTQLAQLDEPTQAALREAMRGRTVFLGMTPVYQRLLRLERALEAADTNPGKEALPPLADGLTPAFLDACLAEEGLVRLGTALDASVQPVEELASDTGGDGDETGLVMPIVTEVVEPVSLVELVGTLVILNVLAGFFEIDRFHFGAPGGLDAGLLLDLIRRQVTARNDAFGAILRERYARTYPQARRALENLFPEWYDCLEGRAKDRTSILYKLNESALSADPESPPLHTPEDAAQRVTDGHGFTLVLRDVSTKGIAQVLGGILRAIRSGNLEILIIKNYRGESPDTPPYFSDGHIERIRLAMEERRRQAPPILQSPPPLVVEGADVLKSSGYTSTQFRIRLRNSDTGAFDLPDVDLHVCGERVYRFYHGPDHLVYDIRAGKDIYQANPALRARFEPEVRPLLEAIETMTEADFQRFTDYRGRIYAFLRGLEIRGICETGASPENPPEPPPDLPIVCHWKSLAYLSELRQQLLHADHPSPEE